MFYHIWELVDNSKVKICVNLEASLKEKIALQVKGKIEKIATQLNINKARLYEYFIHKSSFIPLNVLLNLCKLLKLSEFDIEKKVIAYRQHHSNVIIKSPKLPLKITPLTTFLTSHIYFDGSLPKDGRGTYYNNKSKAIMKDFTDSLNNAFGDVHHIISLDHKGVLKCGMPRIIGEILKFIYKVRSFACKESEISNFILSLPYEHKLAFVIGALVDEGSVAYDGSVIFGVANYKLASQTNKLCRGVGIKTSQVKRKKNSDFYYFYVKNIKTLRKKASYIQRRFKPISLEYKMKRLEKALIIREQKFKYTPDFAEARRKKILDALKYKSTTANNLAISLLISPRSIRRHLQYFIIGGKVVKEKVSNEYLYSLKH